MSEIERFDLILGSMVKKPSGDFVTAMTYYNDTEALKKKQASTGVECRAEMSEAYGEQLKSLQQRNAELEARLLKQAVDWRSIIDENKIKAAAIREACEHLEAVAENSEMHLIEVLEDYAQTLTASNKDGDNGG